MACQHHQKLILVETAVCLDCGRILFGEYDDGIPVRRLQNSQEFDNIALNHLAWEAHECIGSSGHFAVGSRDSEPSSSCRV